MKNSYARIARVGGRSAYEASKRASRARLISCVKKVTPQQLYDPERSRSFQIIIRRNSREKKSDSSNKKPGDVNRIEEDVGS